MVDLGTSDVGMLRSRYEARPIRMIGGRTEKSVGVGAVTEDATTYVVGVVLKNWSP